MLAREACKPFDLDGLPRGPSDAGLLRLGAAQFRRARPDRRARRLSRRRRATRRPTSASSRRASRKMTGFVFKIQANMDPNHRDRIAFVRVCSGKLERGMKAKLVRTGKPIEPHRAAILLRPGPRHRRRGLCRRRGRHPQPRHAAHRRHADRGRGHRLPRRAELRAGNPAPRQAAATP